MVALDKVEFSYDRLPSKAKLYDGTIVDCTVYGDPNNKIDHSNDKPPKERYLDIMIEGCIKYGVKESYIQWLRDHEKQLRAKPEDFKSYEVPEDAPSWTIEEVASKTGGPDQPFYMVLNGKVLEFIGDPDDKIF